MHIKKNLVLYHMDILLVDVVLSKSFSGDLNSVIVITDVNKFFVHGTAKWLRL